MSRTSNLKKNVQDILNSPIKLILSVIVVTLIGYCIQVSIPYRNVSHQGELAYLTQTDPLILKGEEVYIDKGCQYCHTNNMRPFQWEVVRFGHADQFGYFPLMQIGEYNFQSPSLVGSRRIGPDLSRLAGKYDDEGIRTYLSGKGTATPAEAFHNYAVLFGKHDGMSGLQLSWKVRALMNSGLPMSDTYHKSVFDRLEHATQGDALVAYLLSLGGKQKAYEGHFYK